MITFDNLPIRGKLLLALMVTSGTVLVVTAAAFLLYEWKSFRETMTSNLLTLAEIVAANSTTALTFDNQTDAEEILMALRAEPDVMLAALYLSDGKIFAKYPARKADSEFPAAVQVPGYRFGKSNLEVFQPIVHEGKRLGTLYVKADLTGIYNRFRLYGGMVALIMAVCLLLALLVSLPLEKRISAPILALAETAKVVTERKDYSVRAPKVGGDELGALTDAFNEMLAEIREREAALKDREQRLRMTLEGSQTGTWDWDIQSNQVMLDQWSYQLFGLSPGGRFSGGQAEFVSLAHPDDRARVDEALAAAKTGSMPLRVSFRVPGPNGSLHYLVMRGRGFEEGTNGITHVRAALIDVTQIREAEQAVRESEERYRSLVAATTSVVWTADPTGAFTTVQNSWEAYTGQNRAGYQGWGWANAIHPDDRDKITEAWQRAVQGRGLYQAEGRLWSKAAQTYREFQARAVAILASDGSLREWVGTVTDMEDQRAAEREIVRLNAELEERVYDRTMELATANKELEAFTYSVSHDLRAPLRHIDGFARLLEEEFSERLPEEGRSFLHRIRHGIQNMGQLVDDLLNLARVSRQELNRRATALNMIVDTVIADLQGETQNREIEWRVGQLPVLDCDPGLIKQVFVNLLGNAVKYTRPRAKALIEVGQTIENNQLVIFVRDNGVGFNMKFVDKLFGVFSRLHRSEEFEGTGVGLATVERIIRQHGGRVWAKAELDKGATFYFTLPNKRSTATRAFVNESGGNRDLVGSGQSRRS